MPNDLAVNCAVLPSHACVALAVRRALVVARQRRPCGRPPTIRSHAPVCSTTRDSSRPRSPRPSRRALSPARADAADLVAARAYLERFRASDAAGDLTNARERLRRIDPQRFAAARAHRVHRRSWRGAVLRRRVRRGGRRVRFGACAATTCWPADARERVLDWWASALDRDAKPRPEIDRQGSISGSARGWRKNWRRTRPAAPPPTGWPPPRVRRAICRRRGTRRWPAWVRAPLTRDRGVALRADHRPSRAARDHPRPRQGHRANARDAAFSSGSVQGTVERT